MNRPAPDFHLVSQSGQPVSLASLRGSVTLLTFLDPRCTDDCPVATELKHVTLKHEHGVWKVIGFGRAIEKCRPSPQRHKPRRHKH